jgi:5-methylcytosine-specific restriction endonuclease McrA
MRWQRQFITVRFWAQPTRRKWGRFTRKDEQTLKKRYNHTCLCCGRREPEIKLEMDHVIPVVLGGSNSIENRQPLCQYCNSSKGTKIIDYRLERL